ncbi:MAG: hypothetical protein IPG39_17405 [Bacteroidetes bacterium]|nr:hypothetical protein [Bacteroidota bacterium]
MYRITDNQIDFILDDIRARGIGMEELQNDLIDHICCIIEQKLEANGDFEQCYSETICLFFKKELREILMAVTSVGILLLVYLPVNLITGIRNPETKVNTIVSSILMIAGCGLFFSLARSPQGSVKYYCMNTEYFLRNEQLLKTQIQLSGSNPGSTPTNSLGRKLIDKSETLKQFIIEQETGYKSIDENFKANQSWLGETYVTQILDGRQDGEQQVSELNALITEYNAELAKISNRNNMSIENKFSQEYLNQLRVPDMLNNLIQIELKVLSNEQLASK